MKRLLALSALVLTCGVARPVMAQPLSIHDIQYTTDPDGNSPQDGNVVDCLGGIVTHISFRTQPRVYLQDPNHPDGWGAIVIKDWTVTFAASVSVGDRISLTNVLVEEYRDNTFLLFDSANNASCVIESSGNPVPEPKSVSW